MPITFTERPESRRTTTGRSAQAIVDFNGKGTLLESEIRPAFLAFLFDNGLNSYEGLPLTSTTQEHLGRGYWRLSAQYQMPTYNDNDKNPGLGGTGDPAGNDPQNSGEETQPEDPIPPEFTMEIGHETVRVTQSLWVADQAKRTDDPRDIPDCNNAIGVTDTEVRGCDIIVPAVSWTETWTFQRAYVTHGYLQTLESLVGFVNHDTWRCRPLREVMFMGATVQSEGQDKVKITYKFKHSKNVIGYKLTPDFDPVNKSGHQYLDVRYEQRTIGTEPFTVTAVVPRCVYVHEVGRPENHPDFDEADGSPTTKRNFLVLGIGK